MTAHPFDEPEIHPRRAKAHGLLWLMATVLLGASFAYGLPRLAKLVPWKFEERMGRVMGSPVPASACNASPGTFGALDTLVRRIYPLDAEERARKISVTLIPGDTVNAFAYLGGRIYIYEGLIESAESPEEVAGVLAHEIEHVRHRHVIQGIFVRLLTIGMIRAVFSGNPGLNPELAGALINLRFTREEEAEADEDGLKRLKAAKIDSAGFQAFFARLAKERKAGGAVPAILSDHPADEDRAKLAALYRGYPTEPVLSPAEWAALREGCQD